MRDGVLILDESGFVKKGELPQNFKFRSKAQFATEILEDLWTEGHHPFCYTRLKTFVWLSGIRWAMEQCLEKTKDELGMDYYEMCKPSGWQLHILICMLAHFFVWHLRTRLWGKSTIHYSVSAYGSHEACLAHEALE